MKIKLNTGLDVRTGPDNEDGTIPTRRIGEGPVLDEQGNVLEEGDVIDVADVPEWEGKVPHWLIKDHLVEEVKPKAKQAAAKRTARKK